MQQTMLQTMKMLNQLMTKLTHFIYITDLYFILIYSHKIKKFHKNFRIIDLAISSSFFLKSLISAQMHTDTLIHFKNNFYFGAGLIGPNGQLFHIFSLCFSFDFAVSSFDFDIGTIFFFVARIAFSITRSGTLLVT